MSKVQVTQSEAVSDAPSSMGRVLTRKQAKAATRQRLLDGALQILDEEGEAALTTIRVTRLAGIAQPSFYAHFCDMDDLLHSLIDDLAQQRLRHSRTARREAWRARDDVERLRDTFRVPISYSIQHPQLFRLLVRSRHDRSTPLGEWSRQVFEENRRALARDLRSIALANPTRRDMRMFEMIADGVIALTDSLTLGYLEGRYSDLEEIIDVLIAFSRGYFPLLRSPLDASGTS